MIFKDLSHQTTTGGISMTYRLAAIAVCSVAFLGLAACGNSKGDRALSGGAIGAGAGAVGGALLGSPLTGALVGGAVGAGTGALTDKNDIDLGDPIWD
jgi:osmotically inducible lipoprotein OsmB